MRQRAWVVTGYLTLPTQALKPWYNSGGISHYLTSPVEGSITIIAVHLSHNRALSVEFTVVKLYSFFIHQWGTETSPVPASLKIPSRVMLSLK